jgi:hypothetical protein
MIDDTGEIRIRMDSGREVEVNIREHPHLDHGYALTSHSSQGQTADRVLIHVDTQKGKQLVNSRMAYVAVSRGRYDAQIYTNDKSEVAHHLDRDVSHRTAIDARQEHELELGHRIGPSSVCHGTAHDQGVASSSHEHSAEQVRGRLWANSSVVEPTLRAEITRSTIRSLTPLTRGNERSGIRPGPCAYLEPLST